MKQKTRRCGNTNHHRRFGLAGLGAASLAEAQPAARCPTTTGVPVSSSIRTGVTTGIRAAVTTTSASTANLTTEATGTAPAPGIREPANPLTQPPQTGAAALFGRYSAARRVGKRADRPLTWPSTPMTIAIEIQSIQSAIIGTHKKNRARGVWLHGCGWYREDVKNIRQIAAATALTTGLGLAGLGAASIAEAQPAGPLPGLSLVSR